MPLDRQTIDEVNRFIVRPFSLAVRPALAMMGYLRLSEGNLPALMTGTEPRQDQADLSPGQKARAFLSGFFDGFGSMHGVNQRLQPPDLTNSTIQGKEARQGDFFSRLIRELPGYKPHPIENDPSL